MITEQLSQEKIRLYKNLWNEYHTKLKANRKTGEDVMNYLLSKYSLIRIEDNKAEKVVIDNVLQNIVNAEKLPFDKKPDPVAFYIEKKGNGIILFEEQDEIFKGQNIFVGIDLSSGYYCVEGSSLLWDELCVFQGLDEIDLENYVKVAEYILCLKRFNML